MSTGTSAGLLDKVRSQSVFKHQILDSYITPFVHMTGSRRQPEVCPGQQNRVVLLDGFAGRGRYADGTMASSEHMLLAAHKAKNRLSVEVVLVERNGLVFQGLQEVTDEYRARGVVADAYQGDVVQQLPGVLERARGVPLFMFLDPCGRNLPFDVLVRTLNARRSPRPATEVLLNISADLIRRAAGIARKEELNGLAVLGHVDAMCGGDWWRQVALDAHAEPMTATWESAAEAVVQQYADRLGRATGMFPIVVPVKRRQHHQPVYHLVFLTHSPYGLWVFGEAVARARQKWAETLGPTDEECEGMLFSDVDVQLEADQATALRTIKNNLRSLVDRYWWVRLVDHTMEVYGASHGVALEKTVRQAVRELEGEGSITLTRAKQLREWSIRPVPR